MSRNINLYNSQVEQNLDGFDNMPLSKLDDIVNYSVDILFYREMNSLEPDKKNRILSLMLQKIRTGGILILKFVDSKILSKMYWDNQISPQAFMDKISNNKNMTTPEEINEVINKDEFVLSRIEHKEDQILVSINRKEIL
jgi:hypothetical protein